MTLPAGRLSNCTMCTEFSTDGTTWTNFSNWVAVIAPDEWTRDSDSMPTFGFDARILTTGKLQTTQIRLRGIYEDSTATTDPFVYLWNQHTTTCGGALAVRWAPAGCATTNQVFSTATATGHSSAIVAITPPAGDANEATPLVWEALVETPVIYKATYV